jgi:hypothetical protein
MDRDQRGDAGELQSPANRRPRGRHGELEVTLALVHAPGGGEQLAHDARVNVLAVRSTRTLAALDASASAMATLPALSRSCSPLSVTVAVPAVSNANSIVP